MYKSGSEILPTTSICYLKTGFCYTNAEIILTNKYSEICSAKYTCVTKVTLKINVLTQNY